MPQFYFEATSGAGIASEDEAVDLPSLEAARAEAMMMAAEMAEEGGAAPKDIAIGGARAHPGAALRKRRRSGHELGGTFRAPSRTRAVRKDGRLQPSRMSSSSGSRSSSSSQ